MIVWPQSRRNPPLFSYLPLPLPPLDSASTPLSPPRDSEFTAATADLPVPRRPPPPSSLLPPHPGEHPSVRPLPHLSLPPHARTHVATVLDLDTFRFIRLIKHLNLDAGSSLFVCFLFPRAKYVCGVELNHMLHVQIHHLSLPCITVQCLIPCVRLIIAYSFCSTSFRSRCVELSICSFCIFCFVFCSLQVLMCQILAVDLLRF